MVLNAITLYSVAVAKFVESPHTGSDPLILQFLKNIRNLAVEDRMQAIVLSSMAFTLVIWVISMIFLFAALLFWICFIAHYVDKETLTGYCRRKVETRLAKIVKAKTDKIWEKEQKKREKEEGKDIKDGDEQFDIIKRQPTLPVFDESPPKADSFLSRNESVSTLPLYTSQPQTPADDDYLPRMPLSRSDTASTGQYSANASLLGNAGQMGMATSRPTTATSNRSFGSSYSRDQQHPPLPPLSTTLNDPRFPPSARSSPLSSSDRRYSPPGSAPWRTPVSSVDESTQEYEMQEPTLPSVLRPAGARRDMSSPGPNRGPMQPPQRSFTDPSGPGFPRNMTPGAGAGLPRSMTPGAGAGLPRSMTPGGGPPRSPPRNHIPLAGPPRSPPRSHTPGSMRSMTPGDPMRSQTPGMAQSMRPMGNSKPGGWGKGPPGMGPPGPPGMAF
jgi:Fungal potassium channel